MCSFVNSIFLLTGARVDMQKKDADNRHMKTESGNESERILGKETVHQD